MLAAREDVRTPQRRRQGHRLGTRIRPCAAVRNGAVGQRAGLVRDHSESRDGGIPILAAVSAPSSLAVDLAAQSGMTLVAFLRDESMNVYTRPDRVT